MFKGAKQLLMDLEEVVRGFVSDCAEGWERAQDEKGSEEEGSSGEDMVDSEDEEIVVVGRRGELRKPTGQKMTAKRHLEMEKLVYESLASQKGAGFWYDPLPVMWGAGGLTSRAYSRWLVHCIAEYYGLMTFSITVGIPDRRQAYVAIHEKRFGGGKSGLRPLWELV